MTVKNIALIFLLTCLVAGAQTPVITDTTDQKTRDAILVRALRAAIADDTNGAPVSTPVATPTTVPVVVPTTNLPTTPTIVPVPFTAVPTPTTVATPSAADNLPTVAAVPVATNSTAAPALRRPVHTSTNLNNSPMPAFPTFPGAPGTVAAQPNSNTPPTNAVSSTAPKPVEAVIPAGDINFPDMKVEQVLAVYAELVGRTVLHAQLPATTISLKTQTPLTKSEAIQAFDSVLAMNNITMVNVGDKFVKAVPVNLAGAQGVPFNTNDDSELPEADQYITHIAQLKYVKPSELVPALTPFVQIPNGVLAIDANQILIIRDYASNVKRMLEVIKQIDIAIPTEYDSEVIPIKYAQAQDIASALSALGGGTGTTIGRSSASGSGSRTGSSFGGGIGGVGGSTGIGGQSSFGGTSGIGGGSSFGGASSPFGGTTGNTGNTGARNTTFADRLRNLGSNGGKGQGDIQVLGITKIIADQRTNSLLVFASKEDMKMIKKIIAELDIVLAQVLIEGIIMEVSLARGNTVSASYNQTSQSTPGNYFSGIGGINNGTFLNAGNYLGAAGSNLVSSIPGGFSYAANFGNDFQATLTAIATDSRINVLSRPRIQTSHGVAAQLQVGDTVPEVTGTYFGGINGQASSQYQQTFVGINLTVTPLINPDGLVVMDILQDVQQLGTPTTIDGNSVPTTSKRTAQATVSVRNRDTIILGGMISSSKSTSRSGVPLLKDIPGLGYLFRSTTDNRQRTELVVLIRPTVLPTPEAAALVATHERAKMPAVKAAEAEARIEADRELREANKIKIPTEKDDVIEFKPQ